MGLTVKKRKQISENQHFREVNAQIMGEKAESYDQVISGQKNFDSLSYKNKALSLNIFDEKLFLSEDIMTKADDSILVERNRITTEIETSKTHRLEKTRKSRMADAAKAAKKAGQIKYKSQYALPDEITQFETYQALTEVNLSHYEMQKNIAKAMASSQDEEDLLIENAKRSFLIKELDDIQKINRNNLSPKEKDKIDQSQQNTIKEYTKILVKAGEIKKEDAILYELYPQLINAEIDVKKELRSGPDAAIDKGVELSEYFKKMYVWGLSEMSKDEILANFDLIQKTYLYSKHARNEILQADDEINTTSEGANIKFKLDFFENLYRKAIFIKSGTKESNKKYKAVSKNLKNSSEEWKEAATKSGVKLPKKPAEELLPRNFEEEKILKEHEDDMMDLNIGLTVNSLYKEAEKSPGKTEELKTEHYHNLMRFNLDAMCYLSDENLLLKYDELKRLCALGRMYGGDTLNNTEFNDYKYKKQNIMVRMEMVEALCARASLLSEGKNPDDVEVKATRIKLNKLGKRYSIYRREFLRSFITKSELDPIDKYVPNSELKVPKDILEGEKKYKKININDIIEEYEKKKKENADPKELDLLQYVIFQKKGQYTLAGGVKKQDGFREDNVLREPFFRDGIHQLFRTPVFKDMSEDEIRELAYGLSAGITLPTYDQVEKMEISHKEKEDLKSEINKAREKNLSALKTFVEKTEQFFEYIAPIVGTDALSPEFLMIHKNDFHTFRTFGQVIRGVLDNEAIRGLIGKERGDILNKKAEFLGLLTVNAVHVYTALDPLRDEKTGAINMNAFNRNIDRYDKFDQEFSDYYNFNYYGNFMYKDNLKTMLGKE